MSKKTTVVADQDGLRGWDEWNQHMNDPGYYTGGRVMPHLRSGRRNPYGCVLLAGALMMAFVGFMWVGAELGSPAPSRVAVILELLGFGAVVVLFTVTGIRLLLGPRAIRSDARRPLRRKRRR